MRNSVERGILIVLTVSGVVSEGSKRVGQVNVFRPPGLCLVLDLRERVSAGLSTSDQQTGFED
jgi:hypothetical protein